MIEAKVKPDEPICDPIGEEPKGEAIRATATPVE